MKSMMKKTAAILIAVLMMAQVMPALGETYSSGMIVGSPEGYKEALDIVATKGTYVLLGQTLALDANEDYEPEWKSGNPAVATIDEDGVVTAVAEGTATITATVHSPQTQTATIDVTVIDPEPIMTENEPEAAPEEGTEPGETPEGEPEGEPEETPEGEPEGEPGETPEEQPPVPAEKKSLVIVINGENERVTYDGEEHLLDRFVATANEDYFDESKIRIEGEPGVTGKDCGIYELILDGLTFTYDDPDVTAHFVVNNSFLRITPAQVTVTANGASKKEGEEDPELTATVVGLFGEDTIEYTLSREAGEGVGQYMIEAAGEETQGNYRVNYVPGTFEIEGEPVVNIASSVQPDQKVYRGTEITLEAIPAGFGDAVLSYQWQYSTDGENWTDIDGATEKVYTYIIDRDNANWIIRVQVNAAD